MERKFYPENFERFLKGHADEFKITPSKKVWHGIYNDLHPGRRWPSIAMSMVFIFTLVIIGHLNTNNGRNTPLDITSLNTPKKSKHAKISQSLVKYETKQLPNNDNTANETDSANTNSLSSIVTAILPSSNADNNITNFDESKSNTVSGNKNENHPPVSVNKISSSDNQATDISADVIDEQELASTTPLNTNNAINTANKTNTDLQPQANAALIAKRIKNNPVTLTYYVSPSISYRSLSDEGVNNSVTHKPMIGYEAGVALGFNLIKKLKFTTGLQVNYSGYKIRANNTHPIIASLFLNSGIPGQYDVYSAMSRYGNNAGAEFTKLKNYSLQASLPIGLEYEFAGNSNVKFITAANLQPSLVLYSQAYLLSTDRKNYMTGPELFRKWNMNTNLGAYASFTTNSLNWQIGPQVRYQLLSTYSNRYPVKERLINYGIRIGISKPK
ncbi:MAG TPA: outer membrane beta-barrel protein [Chitinophagaceae bacterium]|nr:outer membrane beta-barrel protein [Chitinophagaceae bacterium]